MKQFFHKIIAISLTFVVLFSTLSFTVNKHYCGDLLVDATIFGTAKSCGMKMEKNTSDKDCSLAKKNCCTEKQEVIEGQDELKISFDTLRFEQELFTAIFIHSYISLFEGLEDDSILYENYIPPLVVKDIQKRDETYLI